MDELLYQIKLRLRLGSSDFDDQLTGYIQQAKLELQRIGADAVPDDDPLFVSACELYIKYMLDYETKGQWYYTRYQQLRDSMATMEAYTDKGGDDT